MTSFQSVESSSASTGDNRLQLKLKRGTLIITRSVARDHGTFWLLEVIFTGRDAKNGLHGRAFPSSGESNQSTLDCNDSLSFLPSGVSVDFKLKVQVELKIAIAQFPTDGSCDMWTVNRWKKESWAYNHTRGKSHQRSCNYIYHHTVYSHCRRPGCYQSTECHRLPSDSRRLSCLCSNFSGGKKICRFPNF